MISFIKWSVGIALALTATGQLKPATMTMLKLATEAQQYQVSYSKFTRLLTAPPTEVKKQPPATCANRANSDPPARPRHTDE